MNISTALLIDHLSHFSLLAWHFFAFWEKLKFFGCVVVGIVDEPNWSRTRVEKEHEKQKRESEK